VPDVLGEIVPIWGLEYVKAMGFAVEALVFEHTYIHTYIIWVLLQLEGIRGQN